jgi:hypothetical protein
VENNDPPSLDADGSLNMDDGNVIPIENREEGQEAPLDIDAPLSLPLEEKREESIFAQLIGIVTEVRKMQTRS